MRIIRGLSTEGLRTSCLSLGANAVGTRDELVLALTRRLSGSSSSRPVAAAVAAPLPPADTCSPTLLESSSDNEMVLLGEGAHDDAASLFQVWLATRLPSPPTLVIETCALACFDTPTASPPSPPPLVVYGRGRLQKHRPRARRAWCQARQPSWPSVLRRVSVRGRTTTWGAARHFRGVRRQRAHLVLSLVAARGDCAPPLASCCPATRSLRRLWSRPLLLRGRKETSGTVIHSSFYPVDAAVRHVVARRVISAALLRRPTWMMSTHGHGKGRFGLLSPSPRTPWSPTSLPMTARRVPKACAPTLTRLAY